MINYLKTINIELKYCYNNFYGGNDKNIFIILIISLSFIKIVNS